MLDWKICKIINDEEFSILLDEFFKSKKFSLTNSHIIQELAPLKTLINYFMLKNNSLDDVNI